MILRKHAMCEQLVWFYLARIHVHHRQPEYVDKKKKTNRKIVLFTSSLTDMIQ